MPRQRQDRLIEWFRDLRMPLRRFLTGQRAVPAADVDDIAQEVFLRLLRFDRAELVTAPKAYLFKMAANVASEWNMRSRQRRPHASEWLDEVAAETSVETELELQVEAERLSQALERLPTRARTMLDLHFEEGLTYDAIAERMM